MQILLSERRICNFCKSDNSRLAQVWVCLCVQIGKKYITSLCKANMSHQRRPFFLHFIYVMLFYRWFTLSICQIGLPFFHIIIQCNATSLLKSGYQRDNIIFLGAKGGLDLLPAGQPVATFYCFRVGSGCGGCVGVPIYREYADWLISSPRQLCCVPRSANKICLNGDTHCSHNADFPLYRCGGACEISTNIVTNNRGSRLCHYLETFHGLLTVREHSSLWRYTAENKNCPMQNAY